MRDVFSRLLKVLWAFNILYIVGFPVLAILAFVISLFTSHTISGLGEDIIKFIGICLSTTSILVFLQYVLLGSFNPKSLLKRGSF